MNRVLPSLYVDCRVTILFVSHLNMFWDHFPLHCSMSTWFINLIAGKYSSTIYLNNLFHYIFRGFSLFIFITGSRRTFEFPSRVNFSGPSLYCTSSMDMSSRSNKVDAVRLYASYRLNLLLLKGQRCVLWNSN